MIRINLPYGCVIEPLSLHCDIREDAGDVGAVNGVDSNEIGIGVVDVDVDAKHGGNIALRKGTNRS